MTTKDSLLFHIEPSEFYSWFFESVAGLELACRKLRHSFYACFGYVPERPAVFEERELIASELDSKGRVRRELRVWNEGLLEIKFERAPETRQRIETWGYFHRQAEATQCLAALTRHLPPENGELSDSKVSVNFWNASKVRGQSQPSRESQTIDVPSWNEIASNYPKSIRSALNGTMLLNESRVRTSRLMLWRGLPGTGKTWALRSLMRQWSSWCTFHYIVDPGIFFSSGAYMLSVLSRVGEVREDDGDGRKWSLVILEDAGEFVAIDSRHQYGQALAKLLNLSDGLPGQGQKLLFLITTNEELRNLHPAIAREGRCLTNLEFAEFPEAEAREWMRSRGHTEMPALRRLTLSDLYAAADAQRSIANAERSRPAGFMR
jgi:hypothetical protein